MSLIRRNVLEGVQRVLLVLLVVIVLTVITLSVHVIWRWEQSFDATPVAVLAPSSTQEPASTAVPTVTALSTKIPTVTFPSPQSPMKVGVVVGHWQNDVGAVCPDGLTEVEINLSIAQQVVALLSRAGYRTEILAEFSTKLEGYQAGALVSIHVDSCNVPEASGFKVARVSSSLVPELEDRLVACLTDKYQQATGLRLHRNSITYDMTEYHAFYEIAPETPAAIIEIGFMAADRRLLTKKQGVVARGIVNGIKCFVESTN
jgi:N-acetylmuramoyl-L-alanine amidase